MIQKLTTLSAVNTRYVVHVPKTEHRQVSELTARNQQIERKSKMLKETFDLQTQIYVLE